MRVWLVMGLFVAIALAGCASTNEAGPAPTDPAPVPPSLDYTPPEPDMALDLLEQSFMLAGEGGTQIYVRIVRPDTDEPVPVVTQFTPYTAPGQNAQLDTMLEPAVPNNGGNFDTQFVRRGYAFAYADVRGTGDSAGCLDLRGPLDIEDAWHLTEWLGTQSWSNGKVGFIGASYPGSEAHIAAIADNPHLGGVVPVVASTSFYHYHHNDGVPYFANHLATNSGYTQQTVTPTLNPQSGVGKLVDQPTCPNVENAVVHGMMDQTGSYYEWWQERNLRGLADQVKVPVLMAQGLADWNVKPDHIAHWFNDISPNGSKTLIAGQWGHAYPSNADEAYGDWWPYAAAFFDTHLKGIETGMFEQDVAWVQANDGTWHRSADWPLLQREEMTFHLAPDGTLGAAGSHDGSLSWEACAGTGFLGGNAEAGTSARCQQEEAVQELVFESGAMPQDMHLSGVPLVNLTLQSETGFTHLVVVLEHLDRNGGLLSRENYGYLNPVYRHGIDDPQPLPDQYNVTIDMYPQEDLVQEGERLRLIVRSNDGGSTIESYESGTNTLVWGEGIENTLWLPLRPADMQGTRLD